MYLGGGEKESVFVKSPNGHHNPHFTKGIETSSKPIWGLSLSRGSIYGGGRGGHICHNSEEGLDLSHHLFGLASPERAFWYVVICSLRSSLQGPIGASDFLDSSVLLWGKWDLFCSYWSILGPKKLFEAGIVEIVSEKVRPGSQPARLLLTLSGQFSNPLDCL